MSVGVHVGARVDVAGVCERRWASCITTGGGAPMRPPCVSVCCGCGVGVTFINSLFYE